MRKKGRPPLDYDPQVRVVVLMSPEMASFLDVKSRESGAGNRSAMLRSVVVSLMEGKEIPICFKGDPDA